MSVTVPLRLAYADPPYFGCGKSHYGDLHPDAAIWDERDAHLALVQRLSDEYPDGWALSCNPRDLPWLLPACPEDVRVGAWVKTFHQIRKTSTQFAWEPVIWRGGRPNPGRNPMVRDWLSCRAAMKKGLRGAKPDEFNHWVLDLLGFLPGDVLDDIFPGSGGMGSAIAKRTEIAA